VKNEVLVSPLENLLDSLSRMNRSLEDQQKGDALAIKEALIWGWQSVSLIFNLRIFPHRDHFDQWFRDFFQDCSEEINPRKDIHFDGRSQIGLLQVLDLLSEPDLASLNLEFYHGWRDKATRCRELRSKVFNIVSGSIEENARERLTYLLALHYRFTNASSPVAFNLSMTKNRFPAILDLLEIMWDQSWPGTEKAMSEIGRCRKLFEGD